MAILAGIIFLLFGLGWTGMMLIFLVAGIAFTPETSIPWYLTALWFLPGGASLLVGALLLVIGLFKRKKKKEAAEELAKFGIDAKARVTFVDKNYYILVNQTPIYSIVEFEFRDGRGNVIIGRKDKVESDLVIRNKIEVGSEVDIKYMPGDPSINGLLLADPRLARRQ